MAAVAAVLALCWWCESGTATENWRWMEIGLFVDGSGSGGGGGNGGGSSGGGGSVALVQAKEAFTVVLVRGWAVERPVKVAVAVVEPAWR